MVAKHLTDDEIQQYAFDRSNCESRIIVHVQLCTTCKERVATYELLIAAIAQQPQPRFDFNLSELVVERIPVSKPQFFSEHFFVYLIILASILSIAGSVYLYRSYLAPLFTGIAPLMIYLIAVPTIMVMAAVSIDMYKSYQKKMAILDL